MSTTVTQSPSARIAEIRAEQERLLDLAESYPKGSAEQATYLAEFDALQDEKDELKRAVASRPIADPERTARHESGHAVALHAMGAYCTHLTIVPTETTDGACGMPHGMDAMTQAVALLAGAAGERCFYGGCRTGADDFDVEAAIKLVGEPSGYLFCEARNKARRIVDGNAAAVRGLANLLLREKTLDAQQVYDVLRSYGV